jgi:hypothetical protein
MMANVGVNYKTLVMYGNDTIPNSLDELPTFDGRHRFLNEKVKLLEFKAFNRKFVIFSNGSVYVGPPTDLDIAAAILGVQSDSDRLLETLTTGRIVIMPKVHPTHSQILLNHIQAVQTVKMMRATRDFGVNLTYTERAEQRVRDIVEELWDECYPAHATRSPLMGIDFWEKKSYSHLDYNLYIHYKWIRYYKDFGGFLHDWRRNKYFVLDRKGDNYLIVWDANNIFGIQRSWNDTLYSGPLWFGWVRGEVLPDGNVRMVK